MASRILSWVLGSNVRKMNVQEGLEGASRELQACQSDLGTREGYGAGHLEHNQVAHTGQPGYQAQSECLYETHILLG